MASNNKEQDVKDALSKLLQMGTVVDYQNEFKDLISRVNDISESLLASFYISGLKLKLQLELLRSYSKPTTLGEAFYLARIVEARLEAVVEKEPTTQKKAFDSSATLEVAPTIKPEVIPNAVVHEGLVSGLAEGLKVMGTHSMAGIKKEKSVDNKVGGGTKYVAHLTEALSMGVLVGDDEATWKGMSSSQSTYSLYHLVGKVSFEDVRSVTTWVVECGRQMRKKVVGCDIGRHDGDVVRIWDPGITSFSRHHLEGKVNSKEWGMIRPGL